MTIITSLLRYVKRIKLLSERLNEWIESEKLQLKQIIRNFKIKDSGGLLWSKLAAEISHQQHGCILKIPHAVASFRVFFPFICITNQK